MMKKTVLGKVRRESFLYIVLRFNYKFGSRLLQCFFHNFPIDHLIVSSFFYTVSPPHLHLPHVCQTVCVNTCPISTSHKSSCGSCKAEIHCSGITSTLMRPKSQLQCIECGGSIFLLRYFQDFSLSNVTATLIRIFHTYKI